MSVTLKNQLLLTNSLHIENIIEGLGNLLHNDVKADVVFICQDRRLSAHRVVLAAASPFFRYLFENCDPYNDVHISAKEHEPQLLQKMLHFLYCGEASLSREEEVKFMALLEELEIWGCSSVEIEEESMPSISLMDVIKNTVFEDLPDLGSSNIGTAETMDCSETIEEMPSAADSDMTQKQSSKTIQCKTCGQVFNTRTGLRTHMMIHKGEKPFVCDICNKSFRQASHLKTHHRVHTGEKPFKCDICDRGFAHIGSLNEHKNLHSKDKPYKCDVCQRSFPQRKALRVHHCGENPDDSKLTFPCPHCPRSFSNRRGLAIHRMHQHADSEPLLQCSKCMKTFNNEISYEEHMFTQCD